MAQYFTITEVSRITGLASHTIRYYEKQFPFLLDVDRSPGGHRLYRPKHLEALKKVLYFLKEKKMTIKAAKQALGEPDQKQSLQDVFLSGKESLSKESNLAQVMSLVLERLDQICRSNERRDNMLETFLQRITPNDCNDLLDQIDRCRKETRETMSLYRNLMVQWKNSN